MSRFLVILLLNCQDVQAAEQPGCARADAHWRGAVPVRPVLRQLQAESPPLNPPQHAQPLQQAQAAPGRGSPGEKGREYIFVLQELIGKGSHSDFLLLTDWKADIPDHTP